MYLIYDTETSGLPTFTSYRGYHDPRDVSKYDTSRLVSISWILANENLDIVEKAYYIVRPTDFVIPQNVINIHHITNEIAHEQGKDIQEVLQSFKDVASKATTLVAHNVYFDVNVLKSECYRNQRGDVADAISRMRTYCTMAEAKRLLELPRNPKLADLYKMLYGEDMTNAHNAEYDTWCCYKCFAQLAWIPKRKIDYDGSRGRQHKRLRQERMDDYLVTQR